jgi:hypothetical protein
MTEAFCVRCRKKVEMEEEQTVQYKNKRWAKKGICPECGGKVFRTIPRKKGFLEQLIPLPEPDKKKEKEAQGVPGPE